MFDADNKATAASFNKQNRVYSTDWYMKKRRMPKEGLTSEKNTILTTFDAIGLHHKLDHYIMHIMLSFWPHPDFFVIAVVIYIISDEFK